MFVSSDGDGIYKSQDGGASWEKKNKGLETLGIGLLAIGSMYASDRILLAAGAQGGLYKTNDGGESWSLVMDDGVKVTAVAFAPHLNPPGIVLGDDSGHIWFSHDDGATWGRRYEIPQGGRITALALPDPASNDTTFFIGTSQRGVYKTVEGGARLVELKGPPSVRDVDCNGNPLDVALTDQHVTALALSPNYETDKLLFATTWYNAVFKSGDGATILMVVTWMTLISLVIPQNQPPLPFQ